MSQANVVGVLRPVAKCRCCLHTQTEFPREERITTIELLPQWCAETAASSHGHHVSHAAQICSQALAHAARRLLHPHEGRRKAAHKSGTAARGRSRHDDMGYCCSYGHDVFCKHFIYWYIFRPLTTHLYGKQSKQCTAENLQENMSYSAINTLSMSIIDADTSRSSFDTAKACTAPHSDPMIYA